MTLQSNSKNTGNQGNKAQEHDELLAQAAVEQIEQISLGQILQKKRQNLKIELLDVSHYLKVKPQDIDAIENDDWTCVTKHLFLAGLIRSYAKFLKISPDIIEERIKLLPLESNVNNKKHQLLNIGENHEVTPSKNSFFNFLLISILLFLVLLSLYNTYGGKDNLISSQNLIEKLEKLDL